MVGGRLGPYEIVSLLGRGGMGEVYRARDTKLGREVALKILPREFASDTERLARFLREARALASFNHPHIAAIHGLEEGPVIGALQGEVDTHAIVMELVEGETLGRRIASSPLAIDQAVAIARQLADALDAAHGKGIVHRDLKPANVKLTDDGQVKVLDFGIAKVAESGDDAREAAMTTVTALRTQQGVVLGTAAYMSPEQAQGLTVDGRSDVFSFGIVLYEMLAGRSPFGAATAVEALAKILEARPVDLRSIRRDVPAWLSTLVERCLEKDRERRPMAREVLQTLVVHERQPATSGLSALLLRRVVPVSLATTVLVGIIAGAAWWASGREARAARARVPELLALAGRFDYDTFYRTAREVVPLLPDDLQIKQVWLNLTFPINKIDSTPPGADVWIKGYSAVNAEWIPLGRTPVEEVRVPFSAVRLRLVKDGYTPIEGTLNGQDVTYDLDPLSTAPDGMVRVPSIAVEVQGATLTVPDFWIDRFEVTNRQFKAFVDAGGYRTPAYWRESVVENGRTLTRDEAVARLRDTTGRPGPSTWQLGTYPEGQAEFPVSGVSWYEAAAYAAFAGKALPTAFQWRAAASSVGDVFGGIFSDILAFSNFGTKGTAAVGSYAGIGPRGTYDMAGNVKEWCWNESAGGRMTLGGGWNESSYKYPDLDAQPALSRAPGYGFRVVQNIAAQPPASYDAVRALRRDYSGETPVDDATFEILRGLYRYDPRPLNARLEDAEETPEWRREKVTIDAAYGTERIIVHLFLPRSAAPPYHPVVYFPGGDAPFLRSSRDLRLTAVDFVVRSGRALVFPVYKGTYERSVGVSGVNARRDVALASGKDFGRVLELVDSRSELDPERLGFYGDSRGAFYGVVLTALYPRVRASVLLGIGLPSVALPPEVDLLNFVPRVHVPTLMIAGRNDFIQPVETAQVPLFRLLGVPAAQKRHALFDGGHAPGQLPDVMREILDWFDRYLGPVTPVSNP